VRCLDLDPFSPVGITASQIDFLDLFLLDCLLSDSPRIGDEECERLDDNYGDVVAHGRNRDLQLCRDGGRAGISTLAGELLQRLEPLAELLDDWTAGNTYRLALAEQMGKLQAGDGWQVPSERVLEAMAGRSQGHREWVLEMSLQHQESLRRDSLSEDKLASFRAMAEKSLADQQQLEEADTQPFSEFLEDYLKS